MPDVEAGGLSENAVPQPVPHFWPPPDVVP
jgi:hypothetical protein